MMVRAEISEDGTVKVKNPILQGKQIFLSLYNPEEYEGEEKTNWTELWAALEEIDQLNLPPRSHEDIIRELREFREG